MAPSKNRPSGFSRKAQYSLFAAYVLTIAGAVFAGLLLVISVIDPTGFAALRKIGTEVTAPVARVFDSLRRSVNDLGSNTSAYFDAASKNAALTKEVKANRTKIIEARAVKLENKRLRALLQLKETETGHIAIGRLISSSASSSRRLATLSIGANYGIETGQPVRGPEGLIGRIVEVGPTTARVLLITDAGSPVPVMRIADGIAASGEGTANGMVMIRPVNLGINPFKIGDIVVTSGNGGLFRPNIPYAKVVKIIPDGALARPLANPAFTPYAMVLPIYEQEAMETLAIPGDQPMAPGEAAEAPE
ncbi:rod shape-determining protein MreC [Sphingorhabdus arenilitoris]|uniref:Cell shape-determining protein MreC n=1 Tax=Sphingorhabdus arenilitoris TaxID=1490041 RepID=A0ABV8RGG5_9SPHN